MMKVAEKQTKNNELLEFEKLMKEVSELSPELTKRFSDIVKGFIIGCSMDKDKKS